MGRARLGQWTFRMDPEAVRWGYKMKAADTKCMGGKVIQVYGIQLTNIIVQGHFGRGDRSRGDEAGWEEQLRFREFVDRVATRTETVQRPRPIRFLYPPRNWDFDVYIKGYQELDSYDSSTFELTRINPGWQLELHPLSDRSRVVVRGIQDLYIKRLMNGIGWKQTAYNGPTEEQVAQFLAGRSLGEVLAEEAGKAARGLQQPPEFPEAG